MSDEIKNTEPVAEKQHGKVYKWFENFWYYYKFRTLALIIVGAILTVLIVQCATAEQLDLCVYYIGKDPLVFSEQSTALINSVTEYVDDFDGDGKVRVEIKTYFVGEGYSETAYETQLEELTTAFTGGTVMFLVMDDAGVEFMRQKDWLNNISELAKNTAYDGYAYKLNGTSFFENSDLKTAWGDGNIYMGLRIFNDKSIIHIIKGVDEKYAFAEDTFKKIVAAN